MNKLNWQKVKGGEYFARVGSLWLSEEEIDCYPRNSWEQYELYINKERAGKWYISAEDHSDQDFEQVEFPTLKEAKEALQDVAENILHCYQEQMAEQDETTRLAETEVFQESGKISQDYIDICSELMKESVDASVEQLKSVLEVEPVDSKIDSTNHEASNELITTVDCVNHETSQTTHSEQNDHSSEQNEPDGDDRFYPSEIDSPDPDFDHDTSEIDYPDYSLMVAQVKKDIAEGEFLHKIPHYLKLLQVTREEFDSFVIADVDFDKIGDEDWMDENDELLYDISYEIDEQAVLNRLSQLYEKTDYQALLGKFKEENPHFTVLESKFFTVPIWHLTEQKLLIFGYGGEGNKWNVFSVISFTESRTNHIFDGNYQQSRLIYREYCGNTANFKVYPPREKDPILERYKHELTSDYRLLTKKQLTLF